MMPIFLSIALLAAQGYDPEIEAVMRNRAKARSEAAAAASSTPVRPTVVAPVNSGQTFAPQISVPAEFAEKFHNCIEAAAASPEAGIVAAEKWRMEGGSFYARHCLGFAYAQAERWGASIVAFEQAADEAERGNEITQSARLWGQAGNVALISGDPAKALKNFDSALARSLPDGMEKGEIFLDRARAMVALGDVVGARESLDNALDQAPQDPLAWLLSATLARRMDNLTLAQSHIARAVKLSPDDASVALEEGNIAVLTHHDDVAQSAWQRAVRLAPTGSAGRAAADNLGRLSESK